MEMHQTKFFHHAIKAIVIVACAALSVRQVCVAETNLN